MYHSSRPPRRGGFTLIELLVVIAILATLAALTLAGIGRVRSGQNQQTTEGTLKKAQVAINQQLMTVVEEANSAKSQHVPLLVPFCDGDVERAKALAMYLYAKREFPQTFAEARNPLAIPGVGNLPGHKAFVQVPATASGLQPFEESAALLYMIVHAKGNKGTGSTEEAFSGATGTVIGTGGVSYPVLKDGYGMPIAFVRWYGPYNGTYYSQNAELQAAPYIAPNSPAADRDRFDPLGKLRTWSNANSRTTIALNTILRAPTGSPTIDFDGLNKMMTVVSAGPDKAFNTPDDMFGYQLAQFGAKAN